MLYFNPVFSKNAAYLFDRDFFRLSNRECFEYILKEDTNEHITVNTYPAFSGEGYDILSQDQRARITVDNSSFYGDYIIANYIDNIGNEMGFEGYTPIKDIIVGNMKIATIFQRD